MSAALRSFEAQWRARSPDALQPIRERAMQRFLKLGLPSLRDETWRYTDLRSVAAQSFGQAACAGAPGVRTGSPASLVDAQQHAATLAMINGCPPERDQFPSINGIEINKISDLSKDNSHIVQRFLGAASDAEQRRWLLLNTALFIDGLYVKITGSVAEPLVIQHVSSGDQAQAAHPRVILDVAPGARAIIIEHHLTQDEAAPLSNSNTHIALARDARLEHYRVYASGANATHLDSLDIDQAEGSECRQFTVALGGGLVRSSLEAKLSQPGASLDSYSLLVGHQDRHVDCVNIVTHAAPDTRSRQTARAIASDLSRVIFNSKVIVNPGAKNSDSKQSCRGLLLSPRAEIDTRPQLEIHADEVKCAHGATTGRLDPDMLFYLLSRGLERETAQSLLVYAFLADVLTGMAVSSARSAIENALIGQLPDSQTLRKFR
ncbi:MAG TPA: Fe-S cluster assembly protein SufD [Steroidobacteraceae bacterium]|jgi:Fe-S cluster assembly protein SufD|nr:Fe-S cluster assembly protein SufD [Steroidobacteraceae bacterium]